MCECMYVSTVCREDGEEEEAEAIEWCCVHALQVERLDQRVMEMAGFKRWVR